MEKRHNSDNSSQRESKRLKKSKGLPFNDDDTNNVQNEKLEYEIIQGYRNINNNTNQEMLELDRNSDIGIAMKKLQHADKLFNKAGALMRDPERANNTILAYDSKALLDVSKLTQVSVRNLKLDESKQNITSGDVINSMKKWMLQDYFQQTGLTNESLQSDDETPDGEEDEGEDEEEEDEESLTQAEVEKRAITTRLKERSRLVKFGEFKQFDQFNWIKLGTIYRQLSRKPILPDHLLGPLQVEKKVRTQPRARTAPEAYSTKVATAKSMTNADMNEKADTTTEEYVKSCFKILKKKRSYEPVNLFEFIIDPQSFSRSVENLFYTSFLIKENKLIMEEDEDGYPQIRVVPPLPSSKEERDIEQQSRNEKPLSHLIFQLDIPTYELLIRELNINEKFIDRK